METTFRCLQEVFQLQNILIITGGTILGTIYGTIPGLTVAMSIALIPLITYMLSVDLGVAVILGVSVGATYGGSISSILINIPGTPASMMTGMDGCPMAQKGEAGTASGIAVTSSFMGGVLSGPVLIFVTPKLGSVALEFGPVEYFVVGVFSLSLIVGVVGRNIYKGLTAGLIGVCFNLTGSDPVAGVARYVLGNVSMTGGLTLVSMLAGLSGFREVLKQAESAHLPHEAVKQVNKILPPWTQMLRVLPITIRGDIIGTFVGILPGAGGPIASSLAYDTEKRLVDREKTSETGDIRGVAASESANNGTNGSVLVPLLTLGVPGDGATVTMLGASMMNNITLDPVLLVNHADLVNSIYTSYMVAAVLMLMLGFPVARLSMKVIRVPQNVLIPVIVVLCVIGPYSVKRSISDVGTMIFMGILGYILDKRGFPVIATVLGTVLSGLIERNYRSAAQSGKGSFLLIFIEPIVVTILLLTAITLFWPVIRYGVTAWR